MAKTFPSDEWFDELQDRLNDNETYNQQAEGWGVDFDGDFIFTLQPDGQLSETVQYFIGLEDGKCTGVHRVYDAAEEDNGFEMVGDYSSWQKLVRDELGAIEGIMSGDFELKGSMNTLLKYQDAATTFVGTCSEIDTEFV